MKHNIEINDYDSKSNTLTYFADGKQVDVTGEFEILDGILRHTHEFEDGEEVRIELLVINSITHFYNGSAIDINGWEQRGNSVVRASWSYNAADVTRYCYSAADAAADVCNFIAEHFSNVDDYDMSKLRGELESHFESNYEWNE